MLLVWFPDNMQTITNHGLHDCNVIKNNNVTIGAGTYGNSLVFNGSNSYLVMNLPIGSINSPLTISFTAYIENVNKAGTIVSSRKIVGSGLSIFKLAANDTTANKNRFRFDNSNDTDNSSYRTLFSSYTVPNQTVHHYTFIQTVTEKKLYVDGVLKQTITCAAATGNTAQYLLIGASASSDSQTATDNYFKGAINDLRIYNEVLSEAMIQRLAARTSATPHIYKQLDYHVNFYGAVSNNGIQRVASSTATSLSYAVGKLGSSATFNGTSSKVVFDKPWMPTNGFTIAGWFAASNASTPQGAFASCSTNNYGPVLHFSAGSHNLIVFYYYDSTNYEMAEVPLSNLETLTRWHHYCGTWDGTKLKLYIDGVLKVEQATTHQIYYPADHGNIGFGYRPGSGYFAGRMSEVRLYNYAISPITVKELSLGRVGHYPLNGMAMDSTLKNEYNTDRGTRGKGAINVTNSTIKLAGSPRYQSCYNFSSSAKYINLTNTYSTLNDQKTYNMWVYAANFTSSWSSTNQCGLLSSVEGGGDGWISNGSGTSRKLRAYSYALGNKDLLATDLTAGWHMITHVQDGFKTSVYVDGVLYGSSTPKTSKTALSTKSNVLFLAAECAGTKIQANYWKGRVSDLEIFCTALSADDIMARYKRGHIPTT